MCLQSIFFFFQAEDGIRDYKVTGVQTCALPIYLDGTGADARARPERSADQAREDGDLRHRPAHLQVGRVRSEERRVGKECRCGCWWAGSTQEWGDGWAWQREGATDGMRASSGSG